MKTLVIHPSDRSTDFLKIIYENHMNDNEWTILNESESLTRDDLEKLIKANDRIIMMGHGLPQGLLNPYRSFRKMHGLIIDDSFADLLRTKDTVSIWCWSDMYFRKHQIKGFHTGMIISEVHEARFAIGKTPLDAKQTLENMEMFSRAVRDCIDNTDPNEMKKYVLEHYVGEDGVTQFNRNNVIVLD